MTRIIPLLVFQSTALFAGSVHSELPIENLTPPNLFGDVIGEPITCIRPQRTSGPRMDYEIIKKTDGTDLLVLHIYGHGTYGWSLSFGSANEMMRQLKDALNQHTRFQNKPIVVLGAGAMGLVSAMKLAHANYNVSMIADEWEQTTSYKAVGIRPPIPMNIPETRHPHAARIISESLDEFRAIANGMHPLLRSGASFKPLYTGVDLLEWFKEEDPQWEVFQPKRVLLDFGNGTQRSMVKVNAIFMDTPLLIKELHRVIEHFEIKKTTRNITNFDQIDASVVINATGYGAKVLTNDSKLVPVQGHVIRLKNQPKFVEADYLIEIDTPGRFYYTPKWNGVLGGTFIRGADSLTSNAHEFPLILERAREFFGSEHSG